MTSNDKSPFFNASYIQWIRRFVGAEGYTDLSQSMAFMPFRSDIMMDRNRMLDGEELRNIFSNETGIALYSDIRGCSVLEFLAALAKRVNDTYALVGVDEAFRMFLHNMDLDRCDDEWFVGQRDPECYIQDRCDIMMDRLFNPDGTNGGLFIVRHHDDIRPSEWWWQMQYWLNEQSIPDM